MSRKLEVFISYSWYHSDEEYKEKIVSFKSALENFNCNVTIDDDKDNGRGPNWRDTWAQWMRKTIEESDVVICVTSENYKNCFDGLDTCTSKSGGVSWEGMHLENSLLDPKLNIHIEVVAFNEKDTSFLPNALKHLGVNLIVQNKDWYSEGTGESFINRIKSLASGIGVQSINKNKIDNTRENINNETLEEKKVWEDEVRSCDKIGKHFIIMTDVEEKSSNLEEQLIKDILESNMIDQKHIYFTEEDKNRWKKLISIEGSSYSVFSKCISTLNMFLTLDFWKDLSINIDRIVHLGVGTGEKDIDILKSLIENPNIKTDFIRYVLVDSSFPMLETSLDAISTAIMEKYEKDSLLCEVYENKYQLMALRTDFMYLNKSRDCFQGKENKKSVFFMLGCTLCNIREDLFLDSLKHVCRDGDILVIGVSIHNHEHPKKEDFKNDNYNSTDLTNLLREPMLRLPFANIKVGEELTNDTLIEKETQERWCVVPTSVTMTMNINLSFRRAGLKNNLYNNDVIVATSTKYYLKSIIEFIQAKNFELINEVLNDEEDYAYLSFKFNEK